MFSPIGSAKTRSHKDLTWPNGDPYISRSEEHNSQNVKQQQFEIGESSSKLEEKTEPINQDMQEIPEPGLYSKFKNIHVGNEFSIYEPKPYEEKYSFVSNLGAQVSNDQTNLAVESEKEVDQKIRYGRGYILSILITVFTIEFVGALEIVYMTPYFLKLNLNEWIDATFWMFPLVITTMLKTPVSIIAGHLKYQRPLLFIMMFFSVLGCFMFCYGDQITTIYESTPDKRRLFMTWFGLMAFCFIDVTNEMISLVQGRVIDENEQLCDYLNKKASTVGSIAKVVGYFCGSLQALRISYSEILEKNMDFSFLFAGSLMIFSMILCYAYQSRPTKGFVGSLKPKFKSLKLSHFLPSFKKAWACSRKMKYILLSHFFGAGCIVMLSVYATSWVGQDVLLGDPSAELKSMNAQLFEAGVSWGSLALMLTSFVIYFTSHILHKMMKNPQKEKFKTLHLASQSTLTLALFACLYLDDLNSVFLVIPLTGFAFQTFHAVPELLAELLETEEGVTVAGSYRKLLDFSFFYAQVLMFLIVPLCFIYYPDRDDNEWGMLAAASSGLASVVFCFFI